MTVYGLHASHEQTHPTELLAAVIRAEQAGFDAAMCSDHFSPWSERQGQSAFAWSWLGAALQATSLPFGVVTPLVSVITRRSSRRPSARWPRCTLAGSG